MTRDHGSGVVRRPVGRLRGEAFDEHAGEHVDVGALVHRFAEETFGRRVLDLPGLRGTVAGAEDAEREQQRADLAPAASPQDVGGPQVDARDAVGVEGVERLGDVFDGGDRDVVVDSTPPTAMASAAAHRRRAARRPRRACRRARRGSAPGRRAARRSRRPSRRVAGTPRGTAGRRTRRGRGSGRRRCGAARCRRRGSGRPWSLPRAAPRVGTGRTRPDADGGRFSPAARTCSWSCRTRASNSPLTVARHVASSSLSACLPARPRNRSGSSSATGMVASLTSTGRMGTWRSSATSSSWRTRSDGSSRRRPPPAIADVRPRGPDERDDHVGAGERLLDDQGVLGARRDRVGVLEHLFLAELVREGVVEAVGAPLGVAAPVVEEDLRLGHHTST